MMRFLFFLLAFSGAHLCVAQELGNAPAETNQAAGSVKTNPSVSVDMNTAPDAAQTNVCESATNGTDVVETNAVIVADASQDEPQPQREPVSVPKLTYFVHCEDTDRCGSAFLLEDTNGVWLVSNVHVFSGSTNLTLINIEGNKIKVPSEIEVAKDRDVLRFRVDEPRGLRLRPESCEYDETIYAYGDSGGAGVLTKLEGKAVAIGPDRVEISAEIIPGNSGGPVVNTSDEVVGVSSYLFKQDLPEWITDGTRFTDTRRMALRLNDTEWIPASFSDFCRQTVVLEELETTLHSAIFIAVVLSDDFTHTMTLATENRGLQAWVKKHNRYVEDNATRRIQNNIRHLGNMMERMEEDPTPDCEITIPFLQGKLDDMKDAFSATRKHLEDLSD